MLGNTIAAIATPPGNGGIGIIRISGAEALPVLQRIFQPQKGGRLQPEPRRLYLGRVHDAAGILLDQALAVYMPAPHSYTGEDVTELQCHGGYLVCREILAAAVQAGAKLAEPGEFTSRAFINGKLSLDQAEAVIDIIEAKSTEALKISERQLAGSLNQQLALLADSLLDVLAQLELAVDYPEETDEAELQQQILARLAEAQAQVQGLLRQSREGRFYREGALVAIVGPANAGKSTLLNALLQMERAIVTAQAGTTRDTVEEYYLLDGLPLRLVDTAGIRETSDIVEQAGIKRSKQALAQADLALLMLDASQQPDDFWWDFLRSEAADLQSRQILVLLNKLDLPNMEAPWQARLRALCQELALPLLELSLLQEQGLPELKQAMREALLQQQTGEPLSALLNDRHKAALLAAEQALSGAAEAAQSGFDAAMLSIDVQTAWQALAEISGQTASEEIINRVFERFCLGK